MRKRDVDIGRIDVQRLALALHVPAAEVKPAVVQIDDFMLLNLPHLDAAEGGTRAEAHDRFLAIHDGAGLHYMLGRFRMIEPEVDRKSTSELQSPKDLVCRLL